LKGNLKAFKERGISCFDTDKQKLFCLCRASAAVMITYCERAAEGYRQLHQVFSKREERKTEKLTDGHGVTNCVYENPRF
jgi:hypothetical protein